MRFSIFLALFVLVLCGCGEAPPTIDGYTYKTVKIGEQEWFAENLKTTVYANGDEIPYSRTDESWTTQEMGMRCSYDHDEARSAQYGQLYNWYAVDDERGLCPSGWHVPTVGEWIELEGYLTSQGFAGTEGKVLKSTTGWSENGRDKYGYSCEVNGTDDFGFSALAGGGRTGGKFKFWDAGDIGNWWSSSPAGGPHGVALAWYLRNCDPDIPGETTSSPRFGYSVRCLRDAD